MAVVSGQRVPLSQAAPSVATAAQADWYIRGTPFTIQLAPRNTAQYITSGGVRSVSNTELVYLGDAGGVPVYAEASAVAEFQTQFAEQRTQRGNDLGAILAANRALRTEVDDLQTVYVPIRPVGCGFQALQRQEPVRKSGQDAMGF
jgi:hypothetical protein